MPDSFEKQSLLRINQTCLAWAEVKQRCVEAAYVIQERPGLVVAMAGRSRTWVVMSAGIPSAGWNGPDGAAPFAQQLRKVVQRFCTRIASGQSDDGNSIISHAQISRRKLRGSVSNKDRDSSGGRQPVAEVLRQSGDGVVFKQQGFR